MPIHHLPAALIFKPLKYARDFFFKDRHLQVYENFDFLYKLRVDYSKTLESFDDGTIKFDYSLLLPDSDHFDLWLQKQFIFHNSNLFTFDSIKFQIRLLHKEDKYLEENFEFLDISPGHSVAKRLGNLPDQRSFFSGNQIGTTYNTNEIYLIEYTVAGKKFTPFKQLGGGGFLMVDYKKRTKKVYQKTYEISELDGAIENFTRTIKFGRRFQKLFRQRIFFKHDRFETIFFMLFHMKLIHFKKGEKTPVFGFRRAPFESEWRESFLKKYIEE